MRSSVAFALIGLNAVCWTTIAAAEDTGQATSEKRGSMTAPTPRQVDTTHGLSTSSDRGGPVIVGNLWSATLVPTVGATALHQTARLDTGTAIPAAAAGEANAASGAALTTGRNAGSVAGIASTASVVRTETVPKIDAAIAAMRIGSDRAGAVASLDGAKAAMRAPTGLGSGADFTSLGGATASVSPQWAQAANGGGVNPVGVASWKTALTPGLAATSLRATAVAETDGAGDLTQKPAGATPRSVGVWNNATSMSDPVQRLKPVRPSR
jgi:hypothetical protein